MRIFLFQFPYEIGADIGLDDHADIRISNETGSHFEQYRRYKTVGLPSDLQIIVTCDIIILS